jgi:hypothetical protein
MQSVLQDWVMNLPLRHQGVLLAGCRGCDLAPKMPLDSPERHLTAYIRWCFMVPADVREVDIPGAFMQSRPPKFKPSEFGHYPQHWYSHVMHALQVIGYKHYDIEVREEAFGLYCMMVESLHLDIESHDNMDERLTEDRIRSGMVVS